MTTNLPTFAEIDARQDLNLAQKTVLKAKIQAAMNEQSASSNMPSVTSAGPSSIASSAPSSVAASGPSNLAGTQVGFGSGGSTPGLPALQSQQNMSSLMRQIDQLFPKQDTAQTMPAQASGVPGDVLNAVASIAQDAGTPGSAQPGQAPLPTGAVAAPALNTNPVSTAQPSGGVAGARQATTDQLGNVANAQIAGINTQSNIADEQIKSLQGHKDKLTQMQDDVKAQDLADQQERKDTAAAGQQARESALQTVKEAEGAYTNFKVNPDALFHRQGEAKSAMDLLEGLVVSFVSIKNNASMDPKGARWGAMQNTAFDDLQQKINKDVALQVSEQAKLKDKVGFARGDMNDTRQLFQDKLSEIDAQKALRYTALDHQLGLMQQESSNEKAIAGIQEVRAGLSAEAEKARLAVAQRQEQVAVAKRTEAGAAAAAQVKQEDKAYGRGKDQREEGRKDEELAIKRDAEEKKPDGTAKQSLGIDAVNATKGLHVDDPGKLANGTQTRAEQRDLIKQAQDYSIARGNLEKMYEIRDKFGHEKFDQNAVAQYNAFRVAAKGAMIRLNGLNVSDATLAEIDKKIPSIDDFTYSGYDPSLNALKGLRAEVQETARSRFEPLGISVGGESSGNAESGSSSSGDKQFLSAPDGTVVEKPTDPSRLKVAVSAGYVPYDPNTPTDQASAYKANLRARTGAK